MRKIKISILLGAMSAFMVLGASCSISKKEESSTPTDSSVMETVELQSITLTGQKSGFAYGEAFSVGNLMVMASYSDGSTKLVSNYEVDAKYYDANLPGKYNIVVKYAENGIETKKAYVVTVGNSETVVGVAVKDVKTDYYYGEDFYFSGVVQAQFEDGYFGTISEGFAINSEAYNSKAVGTYQIILSYDDFEASYTVNVLPSITAVNVQASHATTTFTVGKPFEFDGSLTVEYEDGRVETNVQDYTVNTSNYDAFKVGEQEVTITTGGMDYTYTVTVEKATTLKLLTIGNSFSQDTVKWMGDMARSLGFTEVVIGNLVIGGCDISLHYKNSQDNARDYGFEYYVNGSWDYTLGLGTTTMAEGILKEDWDFISLQQASPKSGVVDSYNSDLTKLANYVKETATNDKVQLIWNMTWAYQGGYSGLSAYNNDQAYMYGQITSAVQEKVENNKLFAAVSPAGTAVQNARTSYLGDTLSRDGLHLGLLKGRYISGLTMFCLLTGYTPDEITYRPPTTATFEGVEETMTDEDVLVAKESVTNALKDKYNVTNSAYTERK